jgi:hypothetical protein
MKHIVVTEVDSVTKVPCTEAPQANGPAYPDVKGLALDWADMSTWPVELDAIGVYLRAPKYYGTCDDDADVLIPGVLEVLTEAEWLSRKHDEFYARRPYASWVWDAETFIWSSPVPYPEGAEPWEYRWDEETTSWKNSQVEEG